MGPQPRNASSLQKLEKERKQILHYGLQKECSPIDTFILAHLVFSKTSVGLQAYKVIR